MKCRAQTHFPKGLRFPVPLDKGNGGSGDEIARTLKWFRVAVRLLGAFILVFLQAQIKSTYISHNSCCIYSLKQCIIK